jgi:hypothetical protein
MIDPRQWCSACGLHVASEYAGTGLPGASRLLCPACADDPAQVKALSMLVDLHAIEREVQARAERDAIVQHRGSAMPAVSYDGGRTWHPLPASAVGPLSTEEIREQVTAHTDLTVAGFGGWHLNHVIVDEVNEWTSDWPYSTVGRLGGYPYMPRLHPPRI